MGLLLVDRNCLEQRHATASLVLRTSCVQQPVSVWINVDDRNCLVTGLLCRRGLSSGTVRWLKQNVEEDLDVWTGRRLLNS